jgi:hypothetical protein
VIVTAYAAQIVVADAAVMEDVVGLVAAALVDVASSAEMFVLEWAVSKVWLICRAQSSFAGSCPENLAASPKQEAWTSP